MKKYDTQEFEKISETYQKCVSRKFSLLFEGDQMIYNNVSFKQLAVQSYPVINSKKVYNSKFINFRPNLFKNYTDLGTIPKDDKRIINGVQQVFRKRLQMSGTYSIEIPDHYMKKFYEYVQKFEEPYLLLPAPKKKLRRSAHTFTNIDVNDSKLTVDNEIRESVKRGLVNKRKNKDFCNSVIGQRKSI